ncbi:FAD-dependent oxidoreductase [Mycolicibacterium chubuense]|uniref:Putative epoxidase LasC n=1 Tax=Mycolicibacterium chubuense TaxID=1800 RepID=A0A0J6WIZ6_MYCCU|nr:FAD-dependent oxidoreductase [Mycolicibacterium chubuense]KMO83295.1 putative epoxidase LasC [Mycolicibacterium chubuense]ORA43932.1 FAD-dependent oxidoreductase [Mycolicibacterium chubuense]SPX96131.1 Lycopene cyclase protein [Mycolicibacterium chubuense]
MTTVVVGAGPTGLFTAIALARRGHDVLVIDRDPGPAGNLTWRRRGVMQFAHAHTFRGPVVDALQAEIPGGVDLLVGAGATVVRADDGTAVALRCRRELFERVLRAVASRQHRLTMVTGHVDRVVLDGHRAVGVRVHGTRVSADLVIDASGRAGRMSRGVGHVGESAPCGAAYVTRQYRLRDVTAGGPVNGPIGLSLSLSGYFAVAFVHDNGTFSITITHDGTDPRLRLLRHAAVHEAAVRAIPMLAEWIDRAEPITPVLPGAGLHNSYRQQVDDNGRPMVPGLIAVGDSVCTTTPLAGRGVTLAFRQAQALVELLHRRPRDPVTVAVQFDAWCRDHVRPWFLDHVHCDGERLRRWAGGDIDLRRRLPSDLVVAAAGADASLRAEVAAYERMQALPSDLDRLQQRALAVYASGWRPPLAAGPTRAELGELCAQCATGQPVPL